MPVKKRKTMSAETKAKIAEAHRKRRESVVEKSVEKPVIKKEMKTEQPSAEQSKIDTTELDAILKRLKEKEETLDEKIRSLTATSPGVVEDRSHKKFGTALRKEIPPSDRMGVQKVYVYTGGVYVMSVYVKNDSEVYAPYERPITFDNEQTVRKQTSEGEKYFRISTYSTFSKKECEFIENSPEFGFAIFPNTAQAMKADMEVTYQIQIASRQIDALPEAQILQMSLSYNIPQNLTLSEIRHKLKMYRLAEVLQQQEESTKSMVQNIFSEKASLEKTQTPILANK